MHTYIIIQYCVLPLNNVCYEHKVYICEEAIGLSTYSMFGFTVWSVIVYGVYKI